MFLADATLSHRFVIGKSEPLLLSNHDAGKEERLSILWAHRMIIPINPEVGGKCDFVTLVHVTEWLQGMVIVSHLNFKLIDWYYLIG